ncbi:hypothetical protein BCR44DRAFT_57463 [Catenaria anguillulae PL171]|uniref:Uncharacterized protein n=1 Tax=Catenaria anguillulae PL171 TaxID=765915 RepID=A0A1Y2HWU5_9FUNG|nr:hypothetical protein BCR44DRAFT_57463 [Catenaria anguillulae PL171]
MTSGWTPAKEQQVYILDSIFDPLLPGIDGRPTPKFNKTSFKCAGSHYIGCNQFRHGDAPYRRHAPTPPSAAPASTAAASPISAPLVARHTVAAALPHLSGRMLLTPLHRVRQLHAPHKPLAASMAASVAEAESLAVHAPTAEEEAASLRNWGQKLMFQLRVYQAVNPSVLRKIKAGTTVDDVAAMLDVMSFIRTEEGKALELRVKEYVEKELR